MTKLTETPILPNWQVTNVYCVYRGSLPIASFVPVKNIYYCEFHYRNFWVISTINAICGPKIAKNSM